MALTDDGVGSSLPEWSAQRVLFYAGILTMLTFWLAAVLGLMMAVLWSRAYTLTCTAIPPPLEAPANCTQLAAQASEAATIALLGGVAGFVGLVLAILGARGLRREPSRAARTLRF